MDQLQEAQRQNELSKFPLWYGTEKDTFTAEQWIKRIETTKRDGAWNDQRVMTHVFSSLRSDALLWFEALPRCRIDTEDFNAFKKAFITTYSVGKTARSVKLHINDLVQKPTESVRKYHPRLVRILNDMETFFPAQFDMPRRRNFIPPEITNLVGWAEVPQHIKDGMFQECISDGAWQGLNAVGLMLFRAGLVPKLSDELMKTNPNQLWDAFEEAQNLELLFDTKAAKVNEVQLQEEDSLDHEQDLQIEALSAQLEALKKRKTAKHAGKPTRYGSSGNGNGGREQWKAMKCHYCKKMGHPQKNCFKRKRENGAMVDWKTVKAIEEQEEPNLGAVEAVQHEGAANAFQRYFVGKKALN